MLILIICLLSSGGKSTDDDDKPVLKPIRPNPHGYAESILDTQDLFNAEPVCKKLESVYKKVE